MRQNVSSRKKLNNKGMSLVELLVAVAILAIIIAPLLNGFLISVRTNVKSREKLKANAVAQDLLEGMDALSVEQILYQFNYPSKGFTIANSSSVSTDELLLTTDATTGVTSYTTARNLDDMPSEISNPDDWITCSLYADGTLRPSASHKYYLWAEDLDGYNALVTIDAHASDASNTIYDTYNTNSKAILNVVDADKDAVCSNFQSSSEVIDALNARYFPNASDTKLTQSDVARRIFITMTENSTTGAKKVVVTYRYYFMKNSTLVTYPAEGSTDETNYRFTIFDNSMDMTQELGNIFVLFEPWYSSTTTVFSTLVENSAYKDAIIISNTDDMTNKLYLIKQGYSATDLLESTYKVTVDVRESNYNTESSLQIRTNLDTNIAGTSIASSQAQYVYGSQVKNLTDNHVSGLDETEITDSLYGVTVQIYKKGTSVADLNSGSASPIVTLSGGLLD